MRRLADGPDGTDQGHPVLGAGSAGLLSGAKIQNRPDFSGELLNGVRFLQKLCAGIQHAVLDNSISAVAGGVKHFQTGADRQSPVDELPPGGTMRPIPPSARSPSRPRAANSGIAQPARGYRQGGIAAVTGAALKMGDNAEVKL